MWSVRPPGGLINFLSVVANVNTIREPDPGKFTLHPIYLPLAGNRKPFTLLESCNVFISDLEVSFSVFIVFDRFYFYLSIRSVFLYRFSQPLELSHLFHLLSSS